MNRMRALAGARLSVRLPDARTLHAFGYAAHTWCVAATRQNRTRGFGRGRLSVRSPDIWDSHALGYAVRALSGRLRSKTGRTTLDPAAEGLTFPGLPPVDVAHSSMRGSAPFYGVPCGYDRRQYLCKASVRGIAKKDSIADIRGCTQITRMVRV